VAVETFITSLSGYYHSLLLLKAGVTRDSVLGYAPARFSRPVLEKYDTIRLERAGELLYALYRDIRYSVSPRFELETLVCKLCWLEKWISAEELGDAVAKTQAMLKSPQAPLQYEKQAPSLQQPSLNEEFKRHMANRGNPQDSAPPAAAPADPANAANDPAVKKVLSVFNGTIVEGSGE
jgi:DNA polymerase-3 subunit gamma/tau